MKLFYWIGAVIILLLILEFFLLRYFRKRRRLSKKIQEQIRAHLHKISSLSPREQILEYDKVLDLCLKEKGLSGSLGEKMKKYGRGFQDQNAIWQAHKLRNRIAHELDYTPGPGEFASAARAFQKEIASFLR